MQFDDRASLSADIDMKSVQMRADGLSAAPWD
jgi:hypothetical protein